MLLQYVFGFLILFNLILLIISYRALLIFFIEIFFYFLMHED